MSSRRILLFIDNLCSGGAQRQLCMLGKLLKERGHDVSVLVYHDAEFFEGFLDENKVDVVRIPRMGKLKRILRARSIIRKFQPDIVIAYLDTPTLLAEIAGIPFRKFALVVSERTGKLGKASFKEKLRLNMHRLADAVVTNSKTLAKFVSDSCASLESRLHVIHNCVDLNQFDTNLEPESPADDIFDIVTVGRYQPEKNPFNLAEALTKIEPNGRKKIRLTWYGNNFFIDDKPTKYSDVYLKLKDYIQEHELEDAFILNTQTQNVKAVYHGADAVCLASFYEGFSNVLSEAIACGKPVIASNICDNPVLVKHGTNGMLFDPYDSDDIARIFTEMAELPTKRVQEMAVASRDLANELLSPERFVNEYVALMELTLSQRKSQ